LCRGDRWTTHRLAHDRGERATRHSDCAALPRAVRRGPTVAKAHVGRDFAVVVLGDVQTEVEQSLVAEGEVESVELLRRRIRQMAADEFCAATEGVLGRKVLAMLGDHNPRANSSVIVFLLESERA
jgi:uncharacterized protein YbcI